MPEQIEVSIVLPCLNEEQTIEACIRKAFASLERDNVRGEVVVSDNGSTDRSVEIATNLGARVVYQSLKGYGHALKKGIEESRGQFIIMGDADNSYDFSNIFPFVDKLRQGYELVMGCRLPKGGGTILPGAMPWKNRHIGNPILSFIGRLFFKSTITDFHCGLRGFSKEAYNKMDLTTTGMEFATEMVVKAHLNKLKVTEVPITLHPDGRSRPPHLKPWSDGWRHLRFMFLYSPNYLFLIPGTGLFIPGLVLLVGTTLNLLNLGYPFGVLDIHAMVLGCILALIGFNIINLGVFAKTFAYEQFGIGRMGFIRHFVKHFTLERGVLLGIFIFALGFLVNAYVVYRWFMLSFDLSDKNLTKLTLWGLTLMVVGAQMISSAFFLSIPRIRSDE